MIKPASYWALHKHSDPITLGRVGVALAGRDVDPPLSPAEKALVSVIYQDSEWMDERLADQKNRWAKRQRDKRERDKAKSLNVTQCHGDIGDNPQCHDTSIPPSIHPTLSNESVCNTHTRGDVPDEKTVVTVATTVMGVPETFARWWHREMTARDWTTTDGKPIGNRNWRAQLKAWHNRAKPEELAEINRSVTVQATKPKDVKPEDWLLCAERCAKFRDGRCTAGLIMPPQLRPHAIPPEECQRYAGVKA